MTVIPPDAGTPPGLVIPCTSTTDDDGDGIANMVEGAGDPDGDGIPSSSDDDSDGDGVSDAAERGDAASVCQPADSDADGIYDFADLDSDNDGLVDADERTHGTSRIATDTDEDTVPDLVEVAAATDPLDAASRVAESDFYIVLPYNGDEQVRRLTFSTNPKSADVFFLVDTTGSMLGVRTTIIDRLTSVIIPGIETAIPDLQIGAGGFDDYPVGGYGAGTDRPFYLLSDIRPPGEDAWSWIVDGRVSEETGCGFGPASTGLLGGDSNGIPDILDAVRGLPCHSGGDTPESTGPALYATASGLGLRWTGGSIPDRVCPERPDERSPRIGYPCFRPGALPIIVVFGDAQWHNGPSGSNRYSGGASTAPHWDATLEALTSIGARVISVVNASSAAIPSDYTEVARATGAVRSDGSPLAFRIDSSGRGLDSTVVDAISSLASSVPQDVATTRDNLPGNPDEFDATQFILNVLPLEGRNGGATGEAPGVTYRSKDESTFYEVIPGTEVEFSVTFGNTVRPPAAISQVFRAQIHVVGNGVARLDTRAVYIVVPSAGGPLLI